jgi:hypothetical protein
MHRKHSLSTINIVCSLVSPLFMVFPAYSQVINLDNLPNGEYYFIGPPSPDMGGKPISVLLTKKNNIVIGVGIAFFDGNQCFKGTSKGNSVINVTLGVANHSRMGSSWKFIQGPRPISLDVYTRQNLYDAALDQYKDFHKECLYVLKNH